MNKGKKTYYINMKKNHHNYTNENNKVPQDVNSNDLIDNDDSDVKIYNKVKRRDEKMINYKKEENTSDINTYELDEKIDRIKIKGKIYVYSSLGSKEGTRIKGMLVNLYMINGVYPKLVDSKETDCNGMVLFDNVPEGNYRVIEMADKRYFEKPVYKTWNEVNINKYNISSTIYVINKIKNKKQFKSCN